jgi:hypothetical protein
MNKKQSNPPPQGPKPPAPPPPPKPGNNGLPDVDNIPPTPPVKPPREAVTLGQISGLKLIEKDGSWNITVNVQREHVPPGIEQWAFKTVAVAVMENMKAAEKAVKEDWGDLG